MYLKCLYEVTHVTVIEYKMSEVNYRWFILILIRFYIYLGLAFKKGIVLPKQT